MNHVGSRGPGASSPQKEHEPAFLDQDCAASGPRVLHVIMINEYLHHSSYLVGQLE